MNFSILSKILIFLSLLPHLFSASVPYAGKVSIDGVNYHGEAIFAFEIMDKDVIIDRLLKNLLRVNFSQALKVEPQKSLVSFAELTWEKQFFSNDSKSVCFYSSVHLNTIYILMTGGHIDSHEDLDQITRGSCRLIY